MQQPPIMRIDDAWTTLDGRLARCSRGAFLCLATAVAIVVTLTVFAPRLQLWDLHLTQPFETARAHSFLAQCEAPFRTDVEPAMEWRLLPPLICHWLGLRGWEALALPWLGAVALVAACAGVLDTGPEARGRALLGTVLAATSSALLVPLGWLGLNDAWVWLALLATAFARRRSWMALACLLGPWVDERFLLGLPLALWVRRQEQPRDPDWLAVSGVLPYIAVRLASMMFAGESTSAGFLASQLSGSLTWLPYAPLGWWMAWRVGWLPLVAAGWELWIRSPSTARNGLVLASLTLGLNALLASDLSRSAAILLPAVIWAWLRWSPAVAGPRVACLVLAQLVMPAVHVVYVKIALISPLPLELFRLIRHLSAGEPGP